MKIPAVILMVLTAAFIANASPQGEPADWSNQLNQIRELLKPGLTDSAAANEVKSTLKRYPGMWQKMMETGQWRRFADTGLNNLDADLSAVPGLEAKITEFSQSIKAEIDRQEAAKIAEVEALMNEVGAKLQGAKKPEDLDALLQALSKTKITDYDNSPKVTALSRQLQVALRIVGNWQEYLIAEESGNVSASRSHLQQISSELAGTPLLPRSMVLRLLNPQASTTKVGTPDKPRISVDGIVARLTETGDCATALAELKAMPGAQQNNSNERSIIIAIQAAEDLRNQEPVLTEGEVFANIRNIQQSSQTLGRYGLARAIDQIALNALARSYGIDTPSAKTTSARKVLESMAVRAAEQQNWAKLKQVINSLADFSSGDYNSRIRSDFQSRSIDLKIISLLELGQVAEQRNDLEAAALAYDEASTLDGQYLQRVVGYNKLAALKEKFPDKAAVWLAKAQENRQRVEAARVAAELDMRSRSMMYSGMGNARISKEDLKPMIQEVVAEFLKEKRVTEPKGAEAKEESKKDAQKKAE